MELKLIGQKCDADAHFVDVSFFTFKPNALHF
jgi:hypothetical protein